MPPRRYFLLRCAEDRVFANAVRTNSWPISLGIVDRLNEAYGSGGEIIFIFTVSMSGHFQGAARMASSASDEGRNLPTCKIEWLCRGDVPYTETEHLINPLSSPPQPVRAGKDGTEMDPKVAEELLGLLQQAAANPKPATAAAAAAGGSNASPRSGQPALPAAAAMTGGMPGMVGAGLMGMPDPTFMMGMNPMLAMMNPMMAGMMNAMMMGGMPGMLAASMRPGGLPGMAGLAAPGAAAATTAAPRDAAAADRSSTHPKVEPQPQSLPGPPPGFGGGGMRDRRHDPRDDWEPARERYGPRYDGHRDGHGPPFRDGPPFAFRPPYEHGRSHDHAPPGWPGFGPPPRQRGQQQALERDQDDILEMSYEQYTARFWQLKNVQGGGPASRNGKSADGATGKENAEAATTVPGLRTAAGNAPAAAGAAAAAPDI